MQELSITPPPSSGSATPSGPAGGVLSGTYPNPGFASPAPISSIPIITGSFSADIVKTTTAFQAITGMSASPAAVAGDILEIHYEIQCVSGGLANGVNFNYTIAGGSQKSAGPKLVTLVGTAENAYGTTYYTVQSGDISAGTVAVVLGVALDSTNSTTLKGTDNVYNVFSVKNLKH